MFRMISPQLIALPMLLMHLGASAPLPFDHNVPSYDAISEGISNIPSYCNTEALEPFGSSTTVSRIGESGAAGELIPNFMRDIVFGTDALVEAPDWYRVNGETRTKDLEQRPGTTARIEISARPQLCRWSPGKRRILDWGANLNLQFVNTRGIEVVCRLSSSGGGGSFRHIGVTAAGEPSNKQKVELSNHSKMISSKSKEMLLKKYFLGMERAKQQRELQLESKNIEEKCRKNWHFSHFVPATGSYWTIVVTMLLLGAVPIFGWYALGETLR